MALIEINDVTFTYPQSSVPALEQLSLRVEKGQFVVLFGPSGCGKSTLLRILKNEISPHGQLSGEVLFNGRSAGAATDFSREIGFVFQDPENQVVADEVLHELVFGLENIGLSTNDMRNRVAEIVDFMGAEPLLHRKTHDLSGGQKQQLNLASVLLMQPGVLLLDEPTAQLDPVSAREFLDMLVRLNEEFGMTIIMAEHRLDEVMAVADRVVMMGNGRVLLEGAPSNVIRQMRTAGERSYIPAIPSFYLQITNASQEIDIPLTVKTGRNWLQAAGMTITNMPESVAVKAKSQAKEIIKGKNLFFQYDTKERAVLKELDFSLSQGELYALLGGNGSGKSTLLQLVCGLRKAQRGKMSLHGKPLKSWKRQELAKTIGYLPQNPKLFFLHDTVEKELMHAVGQWQAIGRSEAESLLEALGIGDLRQKHPYDLSGGELQKAALACLLARKPEILVLDEPTKGLDPVSKGQLAEMLADLQQRGMTVMMASHDVEFVAKHATKCGMMFAGKITAEAVPAAFFSGNFFYTTMIQRLFRGTADNILTTEEAVRRCGVISE